MYFEASDEDDLRKRGFSKDGKHQHPQIVLGLLVSENGYPLDYDIFEGNKYEGETLLPIIEHFTSKYSFENLVVVADSGLLSKSNIQKLKDGGYQYILGARIKNMGNSITEQILNLKLGDKESAEIKMEGEDKLIVGYKKSRASKDGKNRKRGLDKLEKAIQGGKLGKSNINNRGYNKYLTMSGEVSISINHDKYNDDSKWDGLKGYMTNCNLSKEDVIKQYSLLWNIERTFRISKSDLQIRPLFHRLRKRIESHICISFAACKVYKELERLLKEKNAGYSAEQAIEIIKTIYKVKIQTPYSEQIYERLIIKNDDQKAIVDFFDLDLN
ncbi:DDE family transposase [Sphingobacterium alimentarium]|uniref:DDE family transposase n=1 Tax=Sphingobacterium alimentarium TaxID=797292 RepID=A0A4R3VWK2_9SPHI|nr:DDE family transposase [Sphingobacterium alimentarium]